MVGITQPTPVAFRADRRNSRAYFAAFRPWSGSPWVTGLLEAPASDRRTEKNGHAHLLERHLARGQSRHPGPARPRLLAGLDGVRRRPRLRGLRPGPRPPCGTRRSLGARPGTEADQ